MSTEDKMDMATGLETVHPASPPKYQWSFPNGDYPSAPQNFEPLDSGTEPSARLYEAAREALSGSIGSFSEAEESSEGLKFSSLPTPGFLKYGLITPDHLFELAKNPSKSKDHRWVYGDQIRDKDALMSALSAKACIFCQSELKKSGFGALQNFNIGRLINSVDSSIDVCPLCGWWRYFSASQKRQVDHKGEPPKLQGEVWGAAGSLKNLDLTDQSVPIQEIRKFLFTRFSKRFSVSPRIFEEVVASVYRDLGYETVVTGKSGDGGIDVVMTGRDGCLIGVQVKRYRNTISVGQIRELTGAMVIKGLAKGMFVTTSDFQRGATDTAKNSGHRGFPVELVNADEFFSALGLAQRQRYHDNSDPLDGMLGHIVPTRLGSDKA
jgi:restriction system protein